MQKASQQDLSVIQGFWQKPTHGWTGGGGAGSTHTARDAPAPPSALGDSRTPTRHVDGRLLQAWAAEGSFEE